LSFSLLEIRKKENLTQQKLAEMVSVTRQTITYIENGGRPSVDLAKRLGARLGFNWQRFYEDTPPPGDGGTETA